MKNPTEFNVEKKEQETFSVAALPALLAPTFHIRTAHSAALM